MTIAIGMLHRSGVLVCADTLISSGTVGAFQSKIHAYQCNDAEVIFAIAGNVSMAESAIQRCETVLPSRKDPRTNANIAESIRQVLSREYKTHILEHGLQGTLSDYLLIVAIRSALDGISLYATRASALLRIDTPFECVGPAYDLGQVFLRHSYKREDTVDRAWNLAAYAIAMAKRFMPGVVGGEPIMLNLDDSGTITFSGYRNFQMAEKYIPWFDMYCGELLSSFMDSENQSRDTFKTEVEKFSKLIEHLRRQWEVEQKKVFWSAAPPAAYGSVIDLRSTTR